MGAGKARDRPGADAGVVFLPVRKTPDAYQVGFFWLGVGKVKWWMSRGGHLPTKR